MKIIFTVLIVCCIATLQGMGQTFNVASFNLRYENSRDSGNLWKDRAPVAAALIRFHQFDIVGTQEGLKNQLEDLQHSLPEYAYYGVGRDDGQQKGEHSAIFYRKDLFTVKDSGSFWLSEHPDRPGFGWDAKINRICSWVKLKPKSGEKQFYVFNVHYDHQGTVARIESSKLMLEKIRQIAGSKPVLLTGDFNGNHESEWYQAINKSQYLKDVLPQAKITY